MKFIDPKNLYSTRQKVKRPAIIKKSPKGGGYGTAKKSSKKTGLFGFKTKRLFILFIALAIMGLLTIFSVQMSHAKVFLDNPTPITSPVSHIEAISSDFKLKPTLAQLAVKKPIVSPARSNNDPNEYDTGYCTWHVDNMRYVPGGWGDAMYWVGNAKRAGWTVSSTPRAGAIGAKGNHVIYVTSVNNDGSFNYSAMNEIGWNKVNYSSHSPSGWYFIY